MRIIEIEDFSAVKEAEFQEELKTADIPSVSKKIVEKNLGMYIDPKGRILTNKYCGYVWLVDKNGRHITDKNKNDVVLHIKPRFGLDVSFMLKKILGDDEFYSYLGLESEEPLIRFFYNEELIENGLSEDATGQLLAVVSFVELLERATRHSIIKKMQKVHENNIGIIKGRIVMNKQLSKNVFQGHQERIYCEHNIRTMDIKENQILKYALKCSERTLSNNDEIILRKINIIKNRFKNVSDIDFSANEIYKVKNQLSNMYMNYITIFEYAKIIIEGASVFSNKGGNTRIVPFAINSHILFECYARTCIKEKIQNLGYVKILKYVPDKYNIPSGDEYGAVDVLRNPNNKAYINGKIIPDIVLKYEKDNRVFYRVYDVKYKDATKDYMGRDDRLQLLAYNFLYNGNCNTGFIFPHQDKLINGMKKVNNSKEIFGMELYLSTKDEPIRDEIALVDEGGIEKKSGIFEVD